MSINQPGSANLTAISVLNFRFIGRSSNNSGFCGNVDLHIPGNYGYFGDAFFLNKSLKKSLIIIVPSAP